MTTATLADLRAIEDLGHRFADAANHRDYDAFAALWTEDAVWQILPPIDVRFTARREIRAAIENLLGRWDFFVQMPHAPVVELEGDRARSRWTVQEIARSADRTRGNFNLAFYHDELVRLDGRWLYAHRTYHTRYFDDSPLPGTTCALPA